MVTKILRERLKEEYGDPKAKTFTRRMDELQRLVRLTWYYLILVDRKWQ